jgi:hypothetical protein
MNTSNELEKQLISLNNSEKEYGQQLEKYKQLLDGSLPPEVVEPQKDINDLKRTQQELQQLLGIFNNSFEE